MVRRWCTLLLAGLLATSLVFAGWTPPVAAEPTAPHSRPTGPAGEVLKSVDVVEVQPGDQDVAEVREVSAPKVAWPNEAASRVEWLSPDRAVDVPGTHLRVAAVGETKSSSVKVRSIARAQAERAAGSGVVYLVEGEPGSTARVELDYAPFADAVGADWGGRLRWMTAPACILDTPDLLECQQITLVESRNDAAAQTLTGDVELTGGSVVVMAAGAPTSAGGDFTSTSLSSASAWSAGGPSGEFSWSYPLRTPPVAGGLAPDLMLGYTSAEADGRTSGSNNQPSWLGEGFDLGVGFIERRYVACADEKGTPGANNTVMTGDLCWLTDPQRTNGAKWDNATLSMAGHSGELVRVGDTAVWRLKDDDGTRVEKVGTAGAASGEYWKVTTTDGTQYFFGKGASDGLPGTATNSVWKVPVAGNHSGEPAYATGFGSSFRSVPWRWNLDYVVTPDGDTMTYRYVAETNKYRQNLATTVSYTRGGYLSEIVYGERQGAESATPPVKVTFTVAERCFNDTSLPDCASATPTTANAYHWPDVPVDSICTATTCSASQVAVTFFTRKRLSQVNTFVRNASAYDAVDRWSFTASYPDSGDGSPNALWLAEAKHTGLGGGTINLPALKFAPSMMVNRVTGLAYGTPLTRARLTTITLETGGKIEIGYQASDCTASSLPTPSTNGKRCFPAYYSESGSPLTLQWFNKYVVNLVLEQDTAQVVNTNNQVSAAGAVAKRTSYSYVGSPTWRYTDSLLMPAKYRTWNTWRGYGKVITAVGDSGSGLAQTVTENLYFRGMHGDKTDTSATKNVTVTDSKGGVWTDEDHLAGVLRETRHLTATSEGSELAGAIYDPYVSSSTANDGRAQARVIDTIETRARQTVTGKPTRTTKTTNTNRDANYPWLVTQVQSTGDEAVTGDETCERMSYASNATAWLIGFPAESSVMPNLCSVPLATATALTWSKTYYDGSTTLGQAPIRGLATKVDQLTGAATRVWKTVTTATYDLFGRPTSSTNVLGQTSTTAYTPASTSLMTALTETSPDPDGTGPGIALVRSTTLDPRWGVPTKRVDPGGQTSEATLDALGRVTNLWLPGRAKSATPSIKYGYGVNVNGVNWVKTEALQSSESYQISYVVSDSLLRERQRQMKAAAGVGRVLADQRYDSRGLPTFSSWYWSATGAPDGKLVEPSQLTDIPSVTTTTFDAAERPLVSTLKEYGFEKWNTSVAYTGDQVKVTPPAGGTPTTTTYDIRGRMTALTEHLGTTPAAAGATTTYTYTAAGFLASMTDPQSNVWSYTYDLAGNQLTASDPDKGITTSTYDLLGNVTSTTDARGQGAKTVYDQLNRPTKTTNLAGTTTLTTTVWDTVKPGLLTSSTRHVGSAQIVSKVNSYDVAGRATSTSMVVPTITNLIPSQLAGTYTTTRTYNIDGSINTQSLPAAGPVPAETLTTGYDTSGNLFSLTGVSGSTTTSYVTDAYYTSLGEPDTVWFGLSSDGWLGRQTYYEASTRRLTTLNTVIDTVGDLELGTFGYDAAGNVVKTTAKQGAVIDTQCYRYDYRRQLTQAWTPSSGDCAPNPTQAGLGGPSPYWKSWTANTVGVLTQRIDRTKTASTTTNFAHPAGGSPRPHFTTSATSTGSAPATATYTADAAGNTLTRNQAGQVQTLAWDTEGKLDTVTVSGTQVQKNVYDAAGNRIVRREPGKTTLYSPAGEITVTHATNAVTTDRYYAFGSSVIALRTGAALGTVTYLMGDHQDTTHIQVNAQTRTTSTKWAAPFGMTRSTTGTWAGQRDFVGGTSDPAVGLIHIGARDYDQHLNRFISVDQILDVGDPISHNAYTYANNNPVTYSDPSGLLAVNNPRPSVPSGPAIGVFDLSSFVPYGSSGSGSGSQAGSKGGSDAGDGKKGNKAGAGNKSKGSGKANAVGGMKLPTISKADREIFGLIAGIAADILITAGICALTVGLGCLLGKALGSFVGYSVDALINDRWDAEEAVKSTVIGLIPIPGLGGTAMRSVAQRLLPAGGNMIKTATQQAGRGGSSVVTRAGPTSTTPAIARTPSPSAGGSVLDDSVVLARGGSNTPDRFVGGSGVVPHPDGTLSGVSVNSGRTVEEALRGIPHTRVGITTVGDVRRAGGTVTRDPTKGNPGHCLISGCTPQQLSELFTPTIRNPGAR